MPTTAYQTFAPSRLDPLHGDAPELPVNLVNGTYAKGTVLGEVTASPGTFKAYASASVDGSQVPKGFLRYPCVVADGVIQVWSGEGYTPTTKSIDMFIGGYFRTQDLVGLDAGGLTAMGGRLVSGTLTNGVVKI